jgi:Ca-activated chloride channel family protein
VLLATLVLMGPSWRQQPSPLSEDQAALVILLDVSTTMRQRDVQPSRLERGKQKIRDLLALRQDKQAALVAYAGSAHPVLHLTADRDILEQYLAAIQPGIMPRPGKFPEYALPAVDDILRQTDAPATLLLVADGIGADSAALFDDYFAARPHQLLILGVGTAGDAAGLVPLERGALRDLAGRTGGHYEDLSVDDSDVQALNRRVNSHYVVLENSALPWLDSGYPLLFPAMALFLMWFRRGWTLTLGLLLAPLLVALGPAPALAQQDPPAAQAEQPGIAARFADLWLTGDQQGRLLMQFGRYRQAARRFDDPLWKGMAYYYAEDFMRAAEYFSRSDSDDALFNEANARAHARDYLRAVRRYDRLLARNPDYPGAAANRARVQYLIDEINRLSESQQDEPGSGNDGKELGDDDAIAAEGAEQIRWEQAELVQFSAEEILQDPDTAAMWLRGVQRDPADFLAAKFAMQLQAAERGGEDRP